MVNTVMGQVAALLPIGIGLMMALAVVYIIRRLIRQFI
jgi:uncharacterized membrane protein